MFLVTGCGRSGTGYIADLCNFNDIKCGHEAIFTPNKINEWDETLIGESSWYAAPFLDSRFKDIPILHIVRNPVNVINSFYRLGLFSRFGGQNFLINSDFKFVMKNRIFNIKKTINRLNHVYHNRSFLRKYTNCLNEDSEILRLQTYWIEWNTLIENRVKHYNLKYLRIKLEDIENDISKINSHIRQEITNLKIQKVNQKQNYSYRELPKLTFSTELKILAQRYGYEI